MKKLVSILLLLGLTGCSAVGVRAHENDYVYTTKPPFTPVSKIPPGSLLSQQVSH
jgi:hypothetical protein